MTTKVYHLSNMYSQSCVKLIHVAFANKNGVKVEKVLLGEVHLSLNEEIIQEPQLQKWFNELGFQMIKDPSIELVEKTKVAAIELIFHSFNANSIIRNSDYISDKLQTPYDKISRVFSQVTGTKFEKYIILLKIEKAKEMMISNDYTVSEIAFMMGYSSVQYFSNQFKKTVGVTISKFKENPSSYRKTIEELI